MAPALRMTRSIKEKLKIFLRAFDCEYSYKINILFDHSIIIDLSFLHILTASKQLYPPLRRGKPVLNAVVP